MWVILCVIYAIAKYNKALLYDFMSYMLSTDVVLRHICYQLRLPACLVSFSMISCVLKWFLFYVLVVCVVILFDMIFTEYP